VIEPLTSPTPPAPEVGEGRWSEGVCGDGAAILFDGVMIPIEKVVQALNRAPTAPPAPAVAPVAGGVIDVLIKAEAILADIVEGESPVDHGPSNAHNYFAEQCGYLESELEKCEYLLSIIRSAIQTND